MLRSPQEATAQPPIGNSPGGLSACHRTIIIAVAKAIEDAHPVRFVQVGEASREPVELPAAALRSSAIQIMGSGLKSVSLPKLLEGIRQTFDLAAQGKLYLRTAVVPLSRRTQTIGRLLVSRGWCFALGRCTAGQASPLSNQWG